MKQMKLIFAVMTVSMSFCSLPVMAENPPVGLDDITVTANKMEEDLQRVPQSISVLDETEIDEMGLKDSMDVLNQIPGILTTPDHGVGVTFRGLKRSMFTSNNPVVIYLDGVPVANSFGFDFSLVNVERIEVLRGPQGTLYGKDAIGAVVNIITKAPDNRWHGKIGTEYSSWNTLHTQADISGSILSDKLFFGVNGDYDTTDGWIKNDYPGANENVGRKKEHDINAYLLFTPTDRLRVRLVVEHWANDTHGANEKAIPYDFMGTGSGYKTLNDFDRNMAEHLLLDMEPDVQMDTNSQALAVSYDFDRFKLESITTHRVRDLDGVYDGDGSAGGPADGLILFGDTKLTSWTEEVRLNSTNTEGLRWIGGLYLDKDEEEQVEGMQMPGAMMESPVNMEMKSVADTDAKTQAVFGQAMLPFGQNFELTLGGRYQRINKKMHQNMFMFPVQGPWHGDVTGMLPMNSVHLDKTWNTFLGKAALAWFIDDNYTAYTSLSQGYMPGGFNFFAMSEKEEANTFDPQKSINYEIGIKANHDTWRFNLAAFYMDITDIHIYKSEGTGIYLTDNADKAHSIGVELETTWLPIKGLELSAAVSLMQAEYDDYDLGSGVTLDGKDMEGAPDNTLRLSAAYHHPSGVYGRADVRHVGNVHYYDDGAKILQKADAYTLANLRLGWLYKNWDIYAFARNLTDEEYINAFKFNITGGVAGFGNPRTIGVGVSYTF